ncbi:MAG: DUF1109 domain-containing protein [Scandinavium sp.]|uniref:DUF1109 domain-containing protein n=1 Tax=Scandinavium sp. TaxID=2830653 RepID=UPI003F3D17CC
MENHEALIQNLSRSAQPVKRPLPVGLRVVSWVLMALSTGALASLLLERSATDWTQPGAAWAIAQLVLVFATGLLAIGTAFTGSIAGRRPLSARWLAALAVIWLIAAAMSLSQHPLSAGSLHDTRCYTFMVTVSAPMIALVLGFLRHTRTLTPLRSLTLAGTGVACMALTLLAFCHPVHLHPEDFLMHIAAIVTIVAATVTLGWRWVRV